MIFDQRGGGRSTPLGEIRDNSPEHLVADIERLRHELGIAEWVMFGGSWGSTLALTYAQAHPERVAGLILRGIFLCRESEIDWFLYGMRTVFPEAWRAFAGFLPEEERGDLLAGYYRRLIHPDPRVHLPAARAWSVYEGACSTLLPNPETVAAFGEDRLALGLARIEAHFFTEHLYPPERDLIVGVDTDPPSAGRSSCRAATTWCARSAAPTNWRGPGRRPSSRIVRDAGHSAMEPGIREQLVMATERAKRW